MVAQVVDSGLLVVVAVEAAAAVAAAVAEVAVVVDKIQTRCSLSRAHCWFVRQQNVLRKTQKLSNAWVYSFLLQKASALGEIFAGHLEQREALHNFIIQF